MAKTRKQIQADYRNRNREALRTQSREAKRQQAAVLTPEQRKTLNANQRARYKSHRKHEYRKLRYGITAAEYQKLFEQQDGLCAICSDPPSKYELCVDHDHETGKVRGLLCRPCNSALGLLEDRLDLVLRAAGYLWKSHAD
jgi:hypothetical protein